MGQDNTFTFGWNNRKIAPVPHKLQAANPKGSNTSKPAFYIVLGSEFQRAFLEPNELLVLVVKGKWT